MYFQASDRSRKTTQDAILICFLVSFDPPELHNYSNRRENLWVKSNILKYQIISPLFNHDCDLHHSSLKQSWTVLFRSMCNQNCAQRPLPKRKCSEHIATRDLVVVGQVHLHIYLINFFNYVPFPWHPRFKMYIFQSDSIVWQT